MTQGQSTHQAGLVDNFIVLGRLADIQLGMPTGDALSYLGEPDTHTFQRKSFPEMLVYGALELRFRDSQLQTIALDMIRPHSLPAIVRPADLLTRTKADVVGLLQTGAVSLVETGSFEEPRLIEFVTSEGVYLLFEAGALVRVVSYALGREHFLRITRDA